MWPQMSRLELKCDQEDRTAFGVLDMDWLMNENLHLLVWRAASSLCTCSPENGDQENVFREWESHSCHQTAPKREMRWWVTALWHRKSISIDLRHISKDLSDVLSFISIYSSSDYWSIPEWSNDYIMQRHKAGQSVRMKHTPKTKIKKQNQRFDGEA